MPLELAKVLRRNDLVSVEGRVKDAFTEGELKVVVSSPRVAKLSDVEAEALRSARKAETPVVALAAAYLCIGGLSCPGRVMRERRGGCSGGYKAAL